MGWPPGDSGRRDVDCGKTPDTRAATPEPIREALEALRIAICQYRGRCGRDPVRSTPFGFFLDAIDAGRDGLHPDDAHSVAMRFLTDCCDPGYRQSMLETIAEWEAEHGIVHAAANAAHEGGS